MVPGRVEVGAHGHEMAALGFDRHELLGVEVALEVALQGQVEHLHLVHAVGEGREVRDEGLRAAQPPAVRQGPGHAVETQRNQRRATLEPFADLLSEAPAAAQGFACGSQLRRLGGGRCGPGQEYSLPMIVLAAQSDLPAQQGEIVGVRGRGDLRQTLDRPADCVLQPFIVIQIGEQLQPQAIGLRVAVGRQARKRLFETALPAQPPGDAQPPVTAVLIHAWPTAAPAPVCAGDPVLTCSRRCDQTATAACRPVQ